jgi:aspartate/methionine/tyrosine aminotransferase
MLPAFRSFSRRPFIPKRDTLSVNVAYMSGFADRLTGFDRPTVWHEFTPLANKHGAINLGQGFPDWKSPDFVKQAMIDAVSNDFNQYCRSAGEINLVKALAEEYSTKLGRTIDPLTEIATSVGATECLFAIMQAFVNSGDEVVMMEPAFDIYPAQVQMAGGVPVTVPMLPPEPLSESNPTGRQEWTFDVDALEAAVTPKTRLILLNTPHNPTGRILSFAELEAVANIVRRHERVLVICDEVYEHIVYSAEKPHIHLASLPGMFDRTITVSSSGKTFSITGWKVGWAVGCSSLINPIMLANQWVQFSVSTPAQKAVADVLNVAKKSGYEGFNSYYEYLLDMYQRKLSMLSGSCREAGLIPLEPEVFWPHPHFRFRCLLDFVGRVFLAVRHQEHRTAY